MADTIETPETPETPVKKPATRKRSTSKSTASKAAKSTAAPETNTARAKSRFGAAMEEAKAGMEALRDEARERTAGYRAKASGNAQDWTKDAKLYAGQAREKASSLAEDGKAKASDALELIGKSIGDSASAIDERLGVKYGDYARSAARQVQEAAAKLDSKSVSELGDDAKDFVRKSPGTALGIAAVAGFVLARMFRGGSDD